MRSLLPALLALCVVTCQQAPRFDSLAACLAPAVPGSEPSLPVLVDRAEAISVVSVTKAQHIYGPYGDGLGARRLTLRTSERLKASTPDEFVIDDGPCPLIGGREGETLVVFLTLLNVNGSGLRPMGLPTSAIRATPARPLATLVSDIRAIRPLDDDARAVFTSRGWTVTAVEGASEFDLPRLSEFPYAGREIRGAVPALFGPLDEYAKLSTAIGLDLRSAAGAHVELLSFWLERSPQGGYAEGTPFGHVVIFQRRIVGAWVTVLAQGTGPVSVLERARVLAGGVAAATFPPRNRFPDGVNVARAYDLASATRISYKTGAGGNGDITDAARVRALASALDMTLPTTQAVRDPSGTPTTYYLHFDFGTSTVSLQYDAQTGMLSVFADGFSVKAPDQFASLVTAIR